MFTRDKEKPTVQTAIDNALIELKGWDATTAEYAKIVDQLTKLYQMKTEERSSRVRADTLATIGANLVGIVLILRHERFDIITSKALGFVPRLR